MRIRGVEAIALFPAVGKSLTRNVTTSKYFSSRDRELFLLPKAGFSSPLVVNMTGRVPNHSFENCQHKIAQSLHILVIRNYKDLVLSFQISTEEEREQHPIRVDWMMTGMDDCSVHSI